VREGCSSFLGSPCYCSRCSGLRFSEGYDVLQAAEGSLLCPQAPVTPRPASTRCYSLLCYVSCMCTEIGKKMKWGLCLAKKTHSLKNTRFRKKKNSTNLLKNKELQQQLQQK
jgi:hypothetical protein